MISNIFTASFASVDSNDDSISIGLTDDQFAPTRYLILQRTLHPSVQDIELNQAGIHVEIDTPDSSAYNAIDKIAITRDSLNIYFLSSFDFGKHLTIILNLDEQMYLSLRESLVQVVSNTARLSLQT